MTREPFTSFELFIFIFRNMLLFLDKFFILVQNYFVVWVFKVCFAFLKTFCAETKILHTVVALKVDSELFV